MAGSLKFLKLLNKDDIRDLWHALGKHRFNRRARLRAGGLARWRKLTGMELQMGFARSEYARKKKTTRREKFLGEMEQVVPWGRLVALIEPHYLPGRQARTATGGH